MILHLILLIVCVVLFLQGFLSSNFSSFNEPVEFKSAENNEYVDKLVIIIIDALRFDFVTPILLPLTHAILNKSEGCVIQVKVESPTVTLPRIKALTTGSIPQFIDVVYNLDSPEVLQDSLLHRAKVKKKNMVFYGDDTWLKLYPKMFLRKEGVHSFFVQDFYEVDLNVTKNVLKELERNDWDIMVTHYLGLDHIGHVHGPYSDLVPKKLYELDEIIEKIYKKVTSSNNNSLILITGDHGMKNSGGHGGSTYAETNVPLIMVGAACSPDVIDQVDITPNLAVMLGLDIPLSSIGQIRSSMLKKLTPDQYLNILHDNSILLNRKSKIDDSEFTKAAILYDEYLQTGNVLLMKTVIELFENFSYSAAQNLIKASVTQDLPCLYICMICLVFLLLNSIQYFLVLEKFTLKIKWFEGLILTLLLLYSLWPHILSLLCFIGICLVLYKCYILYEKINLTINKSLLHFLIGSLFLQPLFWFASSFIEEEHFIWYYLLSTFCLLCFLKNLLMLDKNVIINWFLATVICRFLRDLNRTGDQWAHLPDISDFLTKNYIYLITTVLFAIFSLLYLINPILKNKFELFLSIVTLILVLYVKLSSQRQVGLCQTIYLFIFAQSAYSRSILVPFILTYALLLKPCNLLLLSAVIYCSNQIKKNSQNKTVAMLLHVWLGNAFYFKQGHSNSLASLDVSPGYLALESYDTFLVGFQVVLHAYAMPVLSNLLMIQKLSWSEVFYYYKILFIHRMFALLSIWIVVYIQREHISIWTIYAPKLLIESCHTVLLIVQISLILLSYYCRIFLHGKIYNKTLI